jgi:hypothetical protein
VVVQDILISAPQPEPPLMNRPPLPSDLYDRLRDDIRHRGIQIPILLDSRTGEVIDGKLRKQIAAELGIRDIPTIYVSMLSSAERDDLLLAINVYRRHLNRAQMRDLIAWELKRRPEASDRSVAGLTGVNHRTVAGVRRSLEANGEILRYETHSTSNGKHYPTAAEPAAFACSASEDQQFAIPSWARPRRPAPVSGWEVTAASGVQKSIRKLAPSPAAGSPRRSTRGRARRRRR